MSQNQMENISDLNFSIGFFDPEEIEIPTGSRLPETPVYQTCIQLTQAYSQQQTLSAGKQ